MTLHFRSFVTNNYYRLQMTKMDYNFLEIYYLNFFKSWFSPSEISQRLKERAKDQRKAEKRDAILQSVIGIFYFKHFATQINITERNRKKVLRLQTYRAGLELQ